MAKVLQRLTAGQAPTLLDASRANEIIELLNAMQRSEGRNGVDILIEGDGRLIISIADEFEERELIVCNEDNDPETWTILAK